MSNELSETMSEVNKNATLSGIHSTTEVPPTSNSTGQTTPQTIRRAQSLGEVIEYHANSTPPPLLIKCIKDGSIGFIFGVPKSGKTTYTEHLLMSIAAGRTAFNGYPLVCNNRLCMFISFEETSWGRIERNKKQLSAFNEEEQELVKKNLIVSNMEMPRFVTSNNEWQAVEDEISAHKPGVLVIDSLSHLVMEDNGKEEIARKTMKKLREICSKYKCTVIIINHTPKGANENTLSIASMSGSRIFMQEADFLIGINRTNSNSRYIKLVCARYDKDDDETVDEFIIDDKQCIKVIRKVSEAALFATNDGRVDNSKAEELLQIMLKIAEVHSTNEVWYKDLAYLHSEDEGEYSKQTLFKTLQKLIDNGKIARIEGKKGIYKLL